MQQLIYLSARFFFLFFFPSQEKGKGAENEIAKFDKLLSLVREPTE